jgi:hypothetical protein
MNLASLILSSLSLVAVIIIIGWRSVSLGERSAKASEQSAQSSEVAARATMDSAAASERAAVATERSVVAAERAAAATQQSVSVSERAADATERSVAVSERMVALASLDAQYRRVEAVLDVVLEMRQVFNEQEYAHEGEVPPWVPAMHSPETLERLALGRKLEGRLVPLEEVLDARTNVRTLLGAHFWGSGTLESAITEVKELLKRTTDVQT